ncbi:MAG: tRNA-uridine aminocarboxypropyltransferase [Alphaproteobacteria bacterium]
MNAQPPSPPEICKTCEKPPDLCVCEAISPIDNNIAVVILRHPQEQDRVLGTARIATLQLQNSLLKTGLSWRNLDKVLGQPADPKLWGILYLGTQESGKRLPEDQPVVVLTKKGGVAEEQDEVLDRLQGIILLDGNWQQAKALWWRNAWMLKCRRIVLQPPRPSLYGNLRKEPRRESVSTIEAAAYTLAALENDPRLAERILVPFNALLEKARKRGK